MKQLSNYNIITITLDGFRLDKIEQCNSLKTFKEKSIFFKNMITVSPYTLASMHAIFSGMYPSKNGVNAYYNMFKFKKEQITTIPQFLKLRNYYTSCDIISKVMIPEQGFDERNIFDEKTVDFKKRHTSLIKKLSKQKKFFLYLHYTELHKHLVDAVIQKYKQESTDDEYFKKIEENERRYNSYLPACDEYISAILQTIDECNLTEKTIVILHSDHGTSIGEKKGEKFYGVFVYDYTIKTFCMLKIPGEQPREINKQCRTMDLFPTIAEMVGTQTEQLLQDIHGESLFSLIENPSEKDREVFVETGGLYGPWPSPTRHNVFCVRLCDKKLIFNATPQTWEFYDLKRDPNELNNIYDENSNEIKQLKDRLIYYLNTNEISTNL